MSRLMRRLTGEELGHGGCGLFRAGVVALSVEDDEATVSQAVGDCVRCLWGAKINVLPGNR